jgi:hypothetical protein
MTPIFSLPLTLITPLVVSCLILAGAAALTEGGEGWRFNKSHSSRRSQVAGLHSGRKALVSSDYLQLKLDTYDFPHAT